MTEPIAQWEKDIARDRAHLGDAVVDAALQRSADHALNHLRITPEAMEALRRHGYAPGIAPRGVGGDTSVFISGDIYLRNRVCALDGVEVDGHEGSDLDPNGGCMHCGKEWGEIFSDDE